MNLLKPQKPFRTRFLNSTIHMPNFDIEDKIKAHKLGTLTLYITKDNV